MKLHSFTKVHVEQKSHISYTSTEFLHVLEELELPAPETKNMSAKTILLKSLNLSWSRISIYSVSLLKTMLVQKTNSTPSNSDN